MKTEIQIDKGNWKGWTQVVEDYRTTYNKKFKNHTIQVRGGYFYVLSLDETHQFGCVGTLKEALDYIQ